MEKLQKSDHKMPNVERKKKALRYILVGAIAAIYVLVRLWDLTESCLWFDEIFSVHAAGLGWSELFAFVAADLIHPPLSYLILKIWIFIGGDGLLWLRLFPVLFSTLAVVPFLNLCRELKLDLSTTAVALALFAVNGALIKYAQEVRMYSLLLFLSLMSVWLFSRFFYRGKNIWVLTLVNLLLVYTHYFGWLVVIAEVLAIFAFQRIKIRHVLIMSGVAAVAFVPWMWAVWQAADEADVRQNIGWIERPGLRSLFDFAFDVVEPFYYQQSSAEPTSMLFISIPLLVIIAAAIVLRFARLESETDKRAFFLLGLISSLPVFTAFALSWLLPVSVWGSRHLIVVFAPTLILVGNVLTAVPRREVRVAIIVAVFALVLAAFVVRLSASPPQYSWCAWEDFASELITSENSSPESRPVYAFEDLIAYHLWFALRDFPNHEIGVIKGVEGVKEDVAYFLPRGFDGVRVLGVDDVVGDNIWIAFRMPTRSESPGLSFIPPSLGPPATALESHGYAVEDIKTAPVGRETAYLVRMIKRGF